MSTHESTKALRDELRSPSVVSPAELREASRSFRPIMQKISQQASVLQQLVVMVEEDEPNPKVFDRLETMRQSLRALQRHHDKAEIAYSKLMQCVREFEALAQEIADTIDDAEAGG